VLQIPPLVIPSFISLFCWLQIASVTIGATDPSLRNRLVHRTIGEFHEGLTSRRIAQERSGRSRESGALLLEGSFGEDMVDLAPGNDTPSNASSKSTAAAFSTALPMPGDMGATFKGACQRLVPPKVPEIAVKKIWRSKKPRAATDITLVTQLSIDRIPALANQCKVWGGVISVAVHVPLVDGSIVSSDDRLAGMPLTHPIKTLDKFFAQQENSGRCKLDMLYVYEEVPSLDLVGLYPVNALRNRALQFASTEMVMLIDADFIPNLELSEVLQDPAEYEILRRATAGGQAIVLPALEILVEDEEGQRLAFKAAESKEHVRKMMKNDRLQGFHMDGFLYGHRATDFDRWLDASVAYRAQYEEVSERK